MNLTIPSDVSGPLYRQVFETLKQAIAKGTLTPGQRLPATRELGQQLNISRNTINTAYDMLQAEGYIQARRGSGFYVSAHLPDYDFFTIPDNTAKPQKLRAPSLSVRGKGLAQATRKVSRIPNPAFTPGLPDFTEFPYQQWHQCLQKQTHRPAPPLLGYQDQGGLPELKNALRDYLQISRGLQCSSDQIIVVNGSQAALDLVARMLVDPDEVIAMEEPGYPGAKGGFLAASAKILPVSLDQEGLQIKQLEHAVKIKKAKIKVIYTTPSYQFPLGITMSLPRRLDLLNWANTQNAYIIEDDYDSEFRYSDRPISCLQGLDPHQRVIYMGTFSKVIFPSLRLGYLVVPSNMSTAFANALRKTGQDAPLLLQAAMAKFINDGYFASHIRKMRKLYGEKQALFVSLCHQYLKEWLSVTPTSAGMQLACFFTKPVDEAKLSQEAQNRGLNITPLGRYYSTNRKKRGLYLGYAGIATADMEKNIKTLRDIFREIY